jgi:hypothetical protein
MAEASNMVSATDVWFRTALSLRDVAIELGLEHVEEDAENYWEWVIGTLGDARLDVTRTHTLDNSESDTRIFLLDGRDFSEHLLKKLLPRLRTLARGPIKCGRWRSLGGDEFERVVIRELVDR